MTSTRGAVLTAMVCASAVVAQFVAGKATRDALFLTSLGISALPAMLVVTALGSVLLAIGHGRLSQRLAPRALVPALFGLSGALFVLEWLVRPSAPSATAVGVYLHVSIGGPLLTSAVWLIASESFNPRTARKGYGWIAAAGTLGGLGGALLAERVAALSGVPNMLPMLGGFQIGTAWLVRRLARGMAAGPPSRAVAGHGAGGAAHRSGPRVIAESPQLRVLVALVLLGTTGAALLDFLFKAGAVEHYGPGDNLLRFFGLYYAATSFLSLVLQTVSSHAVLERFGLALTTSAPSIAVLAGSVGSLFAPGIGSLIVARGGESVFRTSWFRSGYELFFTPIPAEEKRAAKSLIDVGVERLGDALGGLIVALIAALGPVLPASPLLWLAMASSMGAIAAASHLNRWYVRTLEQSLVHQAGAVDLSASTDDLTARVLRRVRQDRLASDTDAETTLGESGPPDDDPTLQDILALRSRRIERIKRLLSRDEGVDAALVPHVVPLLAVDALADHAMFALRKVAEERAGELTDVLIDANEHPAVRRRIAQVFSGCVSQRAADSLVLALDDPRFDVRFQVARSLAAMLDRNPRLRIDRERVFEVVRKEAAFVRDRAGQSLAHVFTLLSLVLPREPLQIAFRSLQGADRHLRGTALEYLESILPASIRPQIWPYLAAEPEQPVPEREQATAGLMRSSGSRTAKRVAGDWERRAVAGFDTA